jgi:hypothetical protein
VLVVVAAAGRRRAPGGRRVGVRLVVAVVRLRSAVVLYILYI